ncbi:MAG TPA: hypothetical protein VL091_02935 [Marinobacter sp.]|nr:hypothetical protein [Marinobacter sp.]
MPGDNGRYLRRRMHTPLVVLPLQALLLVVLFAISHQQAFSARADHGFVGNLSHLAVASHKESLRALNGGNTRSDTAADGDPELPDWWYDNPMALWAGLCRTAHIITIVAYGETLPPAVRFLIPLLRAPPVA